MRYQHFQERKKQFFIRMMALALALLLPSMALAEVIPLAYQEDSASREGLVRVRLASLGNLESITLNLRGDYAANNGQFSLPSGTQVKITCNSATGQLTLSASGNSWEMGNFFTLNRSQAGASATITQASKNNPYPADFSFRSTQQSNRYTLLPIAHIQMEDYLYGVLPYELGNSAPLEALKAQAVAARTYTIRMMTNRAGNSYDVVDTDADQVYRGTTSGNENCKAAVDATKGMVLKYGSRYAETYYSSSNGGQTESALNVWGGKGYDYLPVKDDPYDAASGSAKTKTATIYKDLASGSNRQALLTLLKQKAVSSLTQNGYAASADNTDLIWLEKITLHTPKYKAPSKLNTKADFQMTVETVAAGGGSATTSVTVTIDVFRDLESLLGMSLTSSTNEIWTVTENSTAYTLKAGRYGHGVGMSQYGAMEMARQGYSYNDILGFYYPGCVNTKLNLTDTPMEDAGIPSVPGGSDDIPDEPSASIAGYATVIANGFVNLRAEPFMSAPILGIANEGETVKVISLEASWAYVEYEDITAYAMRSLLSEVFQKETAPVTTTEPTEAPSIQQPDASASNNHQLMIFSMDGFVNFRESPDRNSRILMQLPHGALLESMGSNGEFTHVSYQGTQGYVMTAYLVSVSAMNPQSPAVTTPPQPTPSPEATLAPESTPVPSGSVYGNYQAATVTTQRGSLNLRLQASEHASILTKIPQYAQVEATQPQAGWCKVRYAGVEGYVMSCFLTFGAQTTPPVIKPEETIQPPSNSTGQAKVTTKSGSLNLRLSPQSYAAILTTIPKGQMVEVYSVNDGWAFVGYQEYAGFVMTAYLTMQNSHNGNGKVETTPKPSVWPENSPTQSPPQSLPTVPSMELPDGYAAVTGLLAVPGAGNANFRIAPSMNERVLQAVPASEKLVVIATSDQWCIAQWQGMTGYIHLSEVSLYQADALQ